MTDIRLRPYVVRRADCSEIAAIGDLRLASLMALEMPKQRLPMIDALRKTLPDVDGEMVEGGRYFVGDLQGELIGGVGWAPLPKGWRAEGLYDSDGRAPQQILSADAVALCGFFLDPDLGRRAVGANLLAHVEADALRAGHEAAELFAPETAQVMYRSLGYRPVQSLSLRDRSGGAMPVLRMRRSLPVRLIAAA
jgi:GNAT superfamily N-acetyltransferase